MSNTQMAEGPKSESGSRPKRKTVPVSLLVTVIVTFILGLVLGLVTINFLSKDQMTFSTSSIVSFVFTVALGAASITLAGITIVLSRSAEDALIRRSDEGIHLQNEAFLRTNEVLGTIQASTGVTERRLEDLIGGRTGVIAEETLERSRQKGDAPISKEALDSLRESLAETLREEATRQRGESTDRRAAYEVRRKIERQISAAWEVFRAAVVSSVAHSPGVALVSEARGKMDAVTMGEFWDAVLEVEGVRFSLEIHTEEQLSAAAGPYSEWVTSDASRVRFAQSVVWRAREDRISTVFQVWDTDVSQNTGVAALAETIRRGAGETELVLVHGSPPEVARQVMAHLGKEYAPPSEALPKEHEEGTGDSEQA